MSRSIRALWLPTLAVVLPSAFIAILGVRWLSLEREAQKGRSAAAARDALASLQQDLGQQLASDAAAVANAWTAWRHAGRAFVDPPNPAALAERVFVFEASDQLRDLTATSVASAVSERARSLLEQAQTARKNGSLATVERMAIEIANCCAAARDEFGVSIALYGAWMRADLAGSNAAAIARLRQDVSALIARGDLGTASDVIDFTLLAKRYPGDSEWSALPAEVTRIQAAADRRRAFAGQASPWLARVDPPPPDRNQQVIVGRWIDDTAPAAARVRLSDGTRIVMLLDKGALGAWLRRWHRDGVTFDAALPENSTSSGEDAAAGMLFDVPALSVTMRPHAGSPGAGARYQTLFLGAVAAALLLTLAVGYLAVRDRSRELHMASLRAAFVAGVTHELKTPLTSIRLLADTLRAGRAKPPASQDLLEMIGEEAGRLSAIVDNVLSTSRIESGTHAYHPRDLQVADVVRAAVRRFDYVRKKEGFDLVESIDDNSMRVRADASALEQAVLNLLGNAVKYSGTARQLEVRVTRHEYQVEISVTDHGIGIESVHQAKVFDTFYRVPEAASQTTGAGLGLALVRHFASAHGGHVSVNSRRSEGSTFSIWLPLVETATVGIDQPARDTSEASARG